ncbi:MULTISPECIES: ATP-binding protein [unclassified Nonomuraea]|uniref:ATP-binding protein n=1 Tax=unclassified Nonomuraea TaxID=2593643 RepID=UPI0033D692CD
MFGQRLLPVEDSTPSRARRYVVDRCFEWCLPTETREIAELVVSELVTNSIAETRAWHERVMVGEEPDQEGLMTAAFGSFPLYWAVWVNAYLFKGSRFLVVETWDVSRRAPKRLSVDADSVGGRGLEIVDALSDRWGYRWPNSGGKVVFARLPVARS